MSHSRTKHDTRPVCRCGAYPFPHRRGAGACDADIPPQYRERGDAPGPGEPGYEDYLAERRLAREEYRADTYELP